VLATVEAFVEGVAIRSAVLACQDAHAPLYHGDGWMAPSLRCALPSLDAPQYAVQVTVGTTAINARDKIKAHRVEQALQVLFLRDIFGNPFRPITFFPEWRTDTTVSLARTMYESRDFSAMPILADALQDAGCDNDDILSHCRGPVPHVRGFRLVDLVLGKE